MTRRDDFFVKSMQCHPRERGLQGLQETPAWLQSYWCLFNTVIDSWRYVVLAIWLEGACMSVHWDNVSSCNWAENRDPGMYRNRPSYRGPVPPILQQVVVFLQCITKSNTIKDQYTLTKQSTVSHLSGEHSNTVIVHTYLLLKVVCKIQNPCKSVHFFSVN